MDVCGCVCVDNFCCFFFGIRAVGIVNDFMYSVFGVARDSFYFI